jgi:hypothetical protein
MPTIGDLMHASTNPVRVGDAVCDVADQAHAFNAIGLPALEACVGHWVDSGFTPAAALDRQHFLSVSADAFVVDVLPEVDVVLGVRDLDHLDGPIGLAQPTLHFQLFDVDVEPVDAVEDPFRIIDDATGRRDVAVPRYQRCHAPPHALDKLV